MHAEGKAERQRKGSEGLSYLRLERGNTEIHTGDKSNSEIRSEKKRKRISK